MVVRWGSISSIPDRPPIPEEMHQFLIMIPSEHGVPYIEIEVSGYWEFRAQMVWEL